MSATAPLALGLPVGYFVAAGLAALGVLLAAVGVASTARWRFFDQRIREYVWLAPEGAGTEPPAPRARAGRAAGAGAPRTRLGRQLQRRLAGTSLAARIQARLVRAGSARRAHEVIVLQVMVGALLLQAGWLAAGGAPAPLRALLSVALGVLGGFAPLLWLDGRAARRQAAFERQLPQAIDAMASSLQAGSTLNQAMSVLAREMASPISVEFGRVLRETEVGLSFPDALAGLHERVPSGDLLLFVSAISIQQRVGGDLAQIFRTISHTIRERLRVRGEMKVLTAQARYSSYIVAALPILLFAFLWVTNYSYLSGLFQPGITRILLYAGGGGIVLGFWSMGRLAKVDV